jgi:CheY-like chemotaxis protein
MNRETSQIVNSSPNRKKAPMTRILVVDDEVDTLDVLRLFLELSGYEAITTLNSQEAITLAEVEHPDCALLDVMMPGLDGFSLCKMMRAHPLTKNLPIMFVTAYSPMDLEERRIDAGADMVLPKPFGMEALIGAVEKLVFIHAGRTAESAAIPAVTPDDKELVVRKDAPADVFAHALQKLISASSHPQGTAQPPSVPQPIPAASNPPVAADQPSVPQPISNSTNPQGTTQPPSAPQPISNASGQQGTTGQPAVSQPISNNTNQQGTTGQPCDRAACPPLLELESPHR